MTEPPALPLLPDGLTARPLTMADAEAVFTVAAAQEQHDLGKVEIELADIVGDWQRPSWDVESHTVGVFERGADSADGADGAEGPMVAYAEMTNTDRGDAAVHPSYRGRGIGRELAAWMQDTARAKGSTVIGSPVPQGSPGDHLLERLGYHVRWTSWELALPEDTEITPRELPEGYEIRTAEPDEYPAVHTVVEDAFLEWSTRGREPYDDFLAGTVQRPGFEPWNFRVAVDATGEIVGVAHVVMFSGDADEAYVPSLAVRRDQRNRGLAQALLVDAFARGREHGARRSALSTDSRTGALGLYEKIGMVVGGVWLNRAIDL